MGLNLDFTHMPHGMGEWVGGGGVNIHFFFFLEFVFVPLASSAACSRKGALALLKIGIAASLQTVKLNHLQNVQKKQKKKKQGRISHKGCSVRGNQTEPEC